MIQRDSVFRKVTEERNKQDAKWGYPQNNSPFEWISILGEEFGKLAQATNDAYLGKKPTNDLAKIQKYAVQLASVAIALVEHLPEDNIATMSAIEEAVKFGMAQARIRR